MSKLLELSQITKSFKQGDSFISILENLDFSLSKGEFCTLVGESGCGKTTLLQIIGLLDRADSGVIKIAGHSSNSLSDDARTNMRLKKLGFIYQSHNLMPEFTALENVAIPLFLQKKSSKESYEKARYLLDELGLGHRLDHKQSALSGGEQQRVAIARAIIHAPDLILADEPTGNLDPENAKKTFSLLHKIVKERNIAALVVTHNHHLTEFADKIVTIRGKKIVNWQF